MTSPTFATNDLYAAGALKAALSSLSFPRIVATGRLAGFQFEIEPTEAQRILDEYYNDRLVVPARKYALILRDLKGMVCEHRQSRAR